MPDTVRTASVLLLVSLLSSFSAACTPGDVGDPCVPEDEYRTNFSGYAASEVNIESRSFQCESRLCLVNHFQGRVSCPYGQTEEDVSLPPDDPRRCRVPGTSGSSPEDAIEVPVKPWLVERPPEDSVYCSCRCDGPDENANYCECPSGYACVELVPELGLDNREQLTGSYCVRAGTRYNRPSSATCSETQESENCPHPRGVNP